MKKAALSIACSALFIAALFAPCVAQQAFDIAVFPSKLELAAAPGTALDFVINVRNTGTEDQDFRVYNMDYCIKPDNQFVFKEPGHYSYSCARWITTDTPAMLAPAGQTTQKGFTLKVPGDAEPGGHYATIFFEQVSPAAESTDAKARIGVVTLVTVPGEIIREGVIKDVQVASSWWWPTRKAPLLPVRKIRCRVVFENRGNVHLTIKGRLTYTPSFGWGTGTVDLGEITVLPHTTRYLEATLGEESKTAGQGPSSSAPGRQGEQKAPQPPFIGSYKVHAEVQYGPAIDVYDTTKAGDSSFSVYPLSLLAILLILILLILLTLGLLKKWRKSKKPEGEGEPGEMSEGADVKEAEPEDGTGADEDAGEGGVPPEDATDVMESEEESGSEKEGVPEDGTGADEDAGEGGVPPEDATDVMESEEESGSEKEGVPEPGAGDADDRGRMQCSTGQDTGKRLSGL